MEKITLQKKSKYIVGVILFLSFSVKAQINLVKDIFTGSGSGLINNPELTLFENEIYFFADDGIHGKELWKTNGTNEGTLLVKDIIQGSGSAFPISLIKAGNLLFFVANDGINGRELWKSDGTEEGTVMVKEIYPGNSTTIAPTHLFEYNNMLFFAANDGFHGNELWKSDGTFDGTIMVRDINEGIESSDPSNFSIHNNFLYFSAYLPLLTTESPGIFIPTGRELYRTAGDELSTTLVVDIFPGGTSINPNSSYPGPVISFDNRPFFVARNLELGTSTVSSRLRSFNGGSSVSTLSLRNPLEVTKSGNLIYYTNNSSHPNGRELFATNGIQNQGPDLIKDIRLGASGSFPNGLVDFNGVLFFNADDGIHGFELWKSNGTEEGTQLVKDIRPGANGSTTANSFPGKVIQNKLFFKANDGTHGNELWVSDGTENGTFMVMDLNPGIGNSEPSYFIENNNQVYFTATVPGIGYELFKLDLNILNIQENGDENMLKYYVDNQLKILFLKDIEVNSEIQMFNLLGLKVINSKVSDNEWQIETQNLQSGVYVLNIKSENSTISRKIKIE